jgi:hypothetical protein
MRSLRTSWRAAGLPEALRLYDLRHTCASLLIAPGRQRQGGPGPARPRDGQHHPGHLRASVPLGAGGPGRPAGAGPNDRPGEPGADPARTSSRQAARNCWWLRRRRWDSNPPPDAFRVVPDHRCESRRATHAHVRNSSNLAWLAASTLSQLGCRDRTSNSVSSSRRIASRLTRPVGRCCRRSSAATCRCGCLNLPLGCQCQLSSSPPFLASMR